MRYLAFGYIYGLADGGMEDLIGYYTSDQLARAAIEEAAKNNLADRTYLGHVVQMDDQQDLAIVSRYRAKSSHDGVVDSQEWTDEPK